MILVIVLFISLSLMWRWGQDESNRVKSVTAAIAAGVGFFAGTSQVVLFEKLMIVSDNHPALLFFASGLLIIGLDLLVKYGRKKSVLVVMLTLISVALGGLVVVFYGSVASRLLLSVLYILVALGIFVSASVRHLAVKTVTPKGIGIGTWGAVLIGLSMMAATLEDVSLVLFQPWRVPEMQGAWIHVLITATLVVYGYYKSKAVVRR